MTMTKSNIRYEISSYFTDSTSDHFKFRTHLI